MLSRIASASVRACHHKLWPGKIAIRGHSERAIEPFRMRFRIQRSAPAALERVGVSSLSDLDVNRHESRQLTVIELAKPISLKGSARAGPPRLAELTNGQRGPQGTRRGAVHLRGLIEISSHCVRNACIADCGGAIAICPLSHDARRNPRLAPPGRKARLRTVVMQAREDDFLPRVDRGIVR